MLFSVTLVLKMCKWAAKVQSSLKKIKNTMRVSIISVHVHLLYLETARADVTTGDGSGCRRSGAAGGRKLWTRLTDPRRRAARARISVLPPLEKRLQGSQMPDCESLPVDTYPKCQSRRQPQTHFTKRLGAVNGVRIVFYISIYIYCSLLPLALSLSVSISASNEELPWTWSTGYQ